MSKTALKQKGVIQPSQLDITVKTKQTTFDQVRIIPRKTHYVVEIVYSAELQPADVMPEHVAAIDLGLNNLAAVTSHQPGFVPLLVNADR